MQGVHTPRIGGGVQLGAMALLEKLRELGSKIDPSQQVQAGEVAPVLSALIHHQEHGDRLEQAAGESPQAVSDLLAGQPQQQQGEQGEQQPPQEPPLPGTQEQPGQPAAPVQEPPSTGPEPEEGDQPEQGEQQEGEQQEGFPSEENYGERTGEPEYGEGGR